MAPRGRGRGAAAGAGPGRQSARQAQQAQQAENAAAAAAAVAAAAPEPSVPSPSTRAPITPRVNSRYPDGEFARRFTRRRSNRESTIDSMSSVTRATETDLMPTQSEARDLPSVVEQSQPSSSRVNADATQDGMLVSQSEVETPGKTLAKAVIMRKFTTRLFDAADELVAHLANPNRDESWADELVTHRDYFDMCREHYESDSVYLNPGFVLDRVQAIEGTEMWSAIKRAIAAANLASLMDDIELVDDGKAERLATLQRFDDLFAGVFVPADVSGFEAWGPDLSTIKLALDIRTQRLLATMRKHEDVSSLKLFAQIFFDIQIEDMSEAAIAESIESAPLRYLADLDINVHEEWAQEYRTEIMGIRAMIEDPEAAATIEQRFDYTRFSENLKRWAVSFFSLVKAPYGASSAFNGGDDSLGDASYNPNAQLENEAMASQRYGQADPNETIAANIQKLKQWDQQQQPSRGYTPSDYPDISTRELMDQRSDGPSQSSSFTPGSQIQGSIYAAAAAGSSGRKRARVNYAESDDDNFETDKRIPPAQKRTRFAAPSSAMPPPPRPAPSNPGPRPMPSSSMPAPPSSPGDLDIVALTQQSKLVSLANRKSKQPKPRRPWTTHDTNQLVHAINTFKAKWSTIERQIREGHLPFNVPERDQQGLRDKARLVKVDLLKTDAKLPPSFDLVVLGKKEKDMIIAAGRNPDRIEEDIDENGNPVNLVYAPVQPDMPNMSDPSHIEASISVAASEPEEGAADAPADATVEDDAPSESISASVPKPAAEPVFEAPTAPMANEIEVTAEQSG